MKVVSGGDEADIQPKLRRLHTLLFGSEAALAAKDSETALGLALRLLGFLESECKTDEDEVYVRKMLKVVHATIDTARRSLNPERENQERTKSLETRFCASSSSIDLQRIKNSKYFSPIYRTQHTESHSVSSKCVHTIESLPAASAKATPTVPGLEPQKGAERSAPTPARGVVQSKITDYGGNNSKQLGNQYLNGAKPSEICQSHSTVGTSHGITEAVSKAATSKSEARQTAEIVDGDFLPSPDEEDDDKSLWTSYGGGRKRGRNPYLNKKAQNKIRRGLRDGDSDEDSEAVTRLPYGTRNKHAAIKPSKKKQDSGSESGDDEEAVLNTFVTAKQKWATESLSKRISYSSQGGTHSYQNGGGIQNNLRYGGAKSLGVRRGVRGSFIPPVRFNGGSTSGAAAAAVPRQQTGAESGVEDSTKKCLELLVGPDGELPERLRNLEPKLLEHVSNEIMEQDPNVRWDDIAGLEHAKKCVTEMVIWPLLRPDIFQGCRAPGKGLLLFGPPGTGKTMIGKAIAGEAKATFFSISASSLTSKWIGEGEKLVRALFGVASCRQPAVIFIDEVDSLLSQRKADGEHESSRRLKTQFLIEMEGCGSGTEQILLIGATNRPQELDEAARRRLSKRLYIPLPSAEARAWIVRSLLKKDGLMTLSNDEVHAICTSTDGYSGSDMKHLVKEASMGPLREALMQGKDISKISKDEMRPISLEDFTCALQQVRPSVSPSELGLYEAWNRQFGSLAL